MDFAVVTEFITNAGLAVGLAVFFVWQSKSREEALSVRINDLEVFQRDTLLKIIHENSELLSQNQSVLDRCIRLLDRFEQDTARKS